MTEFIVRLTDEQEQAVRRWGSDNANHDDFQAIKAVATEMVIQARDAIALYDQLVAEAKAKSDD